MKALMVVALGVIAFVCTVLELGFRHHTRSPGPEDEYSYDYEGEFVIGGTKYKVYLDEHRNEVRPTAVRNIQITPFVGKILYADEFTRMPSIVGEDYNDDGKWEKVREWCKTPGCHPDTTRQAFMGDIVKKADELVRNKEHRWGYKRNDTYVHRTRMNWMRFNLGIL